MVRRWLAPLSVSLMLGMLSLFTPVASAQSCKCEVIECGTCEESAGISFYTEKCDGGKTKSCQKPQCVPMRNPPAQCAKVASESPTTTFAPLNIVQARDEKKPFGVVVVSRGEPEVQRPDGSFKAAVGKSLIESDVVVTSSEGQLRIMLADKNVVYIGPNSRVKLRSIIPPDAAGHSQITMDLIYGKIRSQVFNKQKTPGKPHFQIRTPAAVAGVRGTDFVVTHMMGGDQTKVETLTGTVQLGGHGSNEHAMIKKGQMASYVAVGSSNPNAIFRDDDIATFVQRGFLTPVIPLSENQRDEILANIDYQEDGSDRIVASKTDDGPLCSKPSGHFNQCAWTCVGNPAGAASCRTDLPGVQCVRSRCDAGGQWRSQERLPASDGRMKCSSDATVVAPCDY